MYAQKRTRPVYELGFHVFLGSGMESLESPGSDVTLLSLCGPGGILCIIIRFGIGIGRMIISIQKNHWVIANFMFNKSHVQQTLC
jgi:hypothetical protein